MIKKSKSLIVFVLCFTMLFNTVSAFALSEPSDIAAESAILVEKSTGTVIYEKNADKKMFPASMTKILTALVLFENFDENDVITVGSEINDISLDSSKAGHVIGEQITVKNLVRGLLIPSGNDSAAVAAVAVSKKQSTDNTLSSDENIDNFVKIMNEKAVELGCTGTNFENPHGYHDDNHYTTARDMSKIVSAAMDNQIIKEIAAEKAFSGNSLGDLKNQYPDAITQEYTWQSHNLLIAASDYNYQYATGFKTGFTDEAGDCVAATAEKDGTELIAIIFNSEDPNRWIDAQKLFDYGFNNYSLKTITSSGDVVSNIGLTLQKSTSGESLDLVTKDTITLYRPNSDFDDIVTELEVTAENAVTEKNSDVKVLKAPVEKDAEIGTVTYKMDTGEVLAQTTVYASNAVEKAGIFARIIYTLKEFASNIFTIRGLISLAVIVVIIIIIIIIIKIIRGKRRSNYGGYSFKNINKRGKF